jgi:hypothetical protein
MKRRKSLLFDDSSPSVKFAFHGVEDTQAFTN